MVAGDQIERCALVWCQRNASIPIGEHRDCDQEPALAIHMNRGNFTCIEDCPTINEEKRRNRAKLRQSIK
jgi:hypothetical protein